MDDQEKISYPDVCKEVTNTGMADQGERESQEEDLSPDIKDWSKHQVKQWLLTLDGVDDRVAEILFQQDISGPSILLLDATDLTTMGVTFGPAKLIIHARDEVVKFKKEELRSSRSQPGGPCKPYPFCRYHDTYRYIESNILEITESGASDFIEPCHEYKAFINTTDETKMIKFTAEVVRFAAACMNSRTNGTIHFGIGDEPVFEHGQVLGVVVKDKEAYANKLKSAIDDHFEHKHKHAAQTCIKPPRFVGVLNKNMTSSDKCVIEVDIVPDSNICEENIYHTSSMNTQQKRRKNKQTKGTEKVQTEPKPERQFFVRDGGSSRDLLLPTTFAKPGEEYKRFVDRIAQLSQLRKEAEEKHLSVIKSSTQGSRLSQMITRGSLSLDKSNFERYVIVTNKSHANQLESLGFLVELDPTAVLDFDPESAECGLQRHFEQQSTVSVHLPAQYKITEGVEDIANRLKLTRSTSWIFCNGRIEVEAPSDLNEWLMEKGASIRDVISFLCRKDVLPNKRFLVVFLLLSTVSERMDPLVETFSTFWQELKGTEQILCISDNENAFTSWRDLINARCGIDISNRCIYELSFAEVNGTILSLWSKNRRSSRLLPCGGGSKVLLEKKVERSLNTLEVLCVNQCEGGNEDKIKIEENFYKGGKVSWWNFFFSEQPGSTPFIKRDKFAFIMNVIPDLCSLRKACVLFNLIHVSGCGGTTLAMHTLWSLRDRFRCAVLRDGNADFTEVAEQVVKLLMYGHEEQVPRVPVLLMIDDFEDKEKVFNLQNLIDEQCAKKGIQFKSAQVILLNCMMSESTGDTEAGEDTVFIGNDLSEMEQRLFDEKLVEIEKTHKNVQTFYGFMIMKKNFKPEYIQGVARKTLKSFNMNQKHAQLLAVLVLLDVYCRGASLSLSLCEDFLDLPQPFCGTKKVKEGFRKFSTLISICSVESEVLFRAVKMIHPRIAKHCLQELTSTHKVSKADIADFLLTTNEFYECTQGKDKLLQDVRQIFVKRNTEEEESKFSPLIHDITNETPGLEEMVLQNASKRFAKDAVVSQLLARYYYLKKKDFSQAKIWANRARELSKDNSYMADTSAQVIKHQLKSVIANDKEQQISPEKFNMCLKLAQSAIEAFKETQSLAKKESLQRLKIKTDNCPFNTSGCLGEIQVGVLVIEVLAKMPIFSSDSIRHDIMSQFLSGDFKVLEIETHDQQHTKHRNYNIILRQFEDELSNLKYRMKVNIDFLDDFYVNLGSRFGMKDKREEVAQKELFRCFQQYAKLFCETDSADLVRNKTMPAMLKLHQARQYLEKHKADTYSGILSYLSSGIFPEKMEKIAKQYDVIRQSGHTMTVKERINFLYVNVVLSHLKLESKFLLPYQTLVHLLCQVLREPVPLSDHLSLNFIAVVLLWPQHHPVMPQCRNLGEYISQLMHSYHTMMKEVYNGKSPIIHFFLGRKQGYERLVPLGEIQKCVTTEQEQFSSMWKNGKIWKEKKVEELLCRVTGQVTSDNLILADTPGPKVKVTPVFRSELSGHVLGSKVSFFIGFSMKGPVALDIH